MNDVDLSIIVVSYNTNDMTGECLKSVFESVCDMNIQVIVVDNNSTDGSAEMIERLFPQAQLIRNLDNKGFAAANNQGFAIATGRYMLLLNSDTIVLGNVLENSLRFMEKRPEVGALGCRVLNTDRTIQRTCSGYPTLWRLFMMTVGLDRLMALMGRDNYQLRHWERDTERNVEVISGCYLLIRREVLDQVGGLDEGFFFFGEETDWCLRIRRAGWRLLFSPVGEIIHHGGGSVKKLNHKRDVMLTEATINLHRKNGGREAAILAFLILAAFNGSRAIIWSAGGFWKQSCRDRARHFRQVFVCSRSTWPEQK